MEHSLTTQVLSWLAIAILSVSYWFQIWKIHVHQEVRDLSFTYHVLLAIGFGILTYTAYVENSFIFMVKQVATTVPVIVIMLQILIHRKDRWHDDELPHCEECHQELEDGWNFCSFCGLKQSSEAV